MPSGVRLPFATYGETEKIKTRKCLMGLGINGLRFSLNFQYMLWSTYYQNIEPCFSFSQCMVAMATSYKDLDFKAAK